MNLNRLKAALVTGVLLVSLGSKAQQTYQLSVSEAVDMAFKNLPSLKNLEIDYKIQESVNKQITASAYPQLNGTASLNHYLQLPQLLFPDGTAAAIYQILKDEGVRNGSGQPISKDVEVMMRQVSFQQPWNASVGATLSQLLFQPDVFVGLKARSATLEYARMNLEVEKEKAREQAYKQYYAVLIAEKQLVFIRDGIKRLDKLLHDANIMYDNGFLEKLDIDKITVPLNNLRTQQNTLENGISLSYASLKYAIGISQRDSIQLRDTLTVEWLKRDIPMIDSFSYNNRKELQLLNTARKLQELDLKRQKLSNLPTVSAFLDYTAQGQAQKFVTDKDALWIRTSMVGLQLKVPIFTGFLRKHKVTEATLKLEKVDNNISMLKQTIDFDQSINKRSFINALLNLDIQQRNMELARTIYNTTKKKYEQGLARNDEVLQDERAITDAESSYFNALYQATIARISYLRALGQLN